MRELSKNPLENLDKLVDATQDVMAKREALKEAEKEAANKIATVANVVEAVNKSGFTLKTSENGGQKLSGENELINPGDVVEMVAGKNMTVKQEANGKITYATKDDVNFTSVQFGENGPKISKDDSGNIKISGNNGKDPVKITNVAAGEALTDAVNVSQLNSGLNNVKQELGDTINQHAAAINRNTQNIHKLGQRLNSGIANATALATLDFQEIGINQAVVGAAVGTYRDSQAVAVGIKGAPTENIRVQAKVSVAPGVNGAMDATAGIGASYRFNLK